MKAVLGIDAAWTLNSPSGVALGVKRQNGWHLIACAASYQRFHAFAHGNLNPEKRPSGSDPQPSMLLTSAFSLVGNEIDLVAIDMPIARSPIVGRRASDNAISKFYGAKWCATHTPSATRPGFLSDNLRKSFEEVGYPHLTSEIRSRGLIEVYPHPALVELSGASTRLPYKASRLRSYWPSASPAERRERLFRQWAEIVKLLEREITGVVSALPKLELNASGVEIKAYEDMLDAIVCVWVGISALEGSAKPYGDDDSAIWVPN